MLCVDRVQLCCQSGCKVCDHAILVMYVIVWHKNIARRVVDPRVCTVAYHAKRIARVFFYTPLVAVKQKKIGAYMYIYIYMYVYTELDVYIRLLAYYRCQNTMQLTLHSIVSYYGNNSTTRVLLESHIRLSYPINALFHLECAKVSPRDSWVVRLLLAGVLTRDAERERERYIPTNERCLICKHIQVYIYIYIY